MKINEEAKKHFSKEVLAPPSPEENFTVNTTTLSQHGCYLHYFLLGVMWAESRLKEEAK